MPGADDVPSPLGPDPETPQHGGQCLKCGGDLVVCTQCKTTSYCPACALPRRRKRTRVLRQDPAGVTWAREKAGLTKRALAQQVGISEQLMDEIESGWRSATPANLAKITEVLRCPVVILERNPPDPSRRGAEPAQQGR